VDSIIIDNVVKSLWLPQ